MPEMHHCSLIFEVNGRNYWFDAGENCAHRAFTDGVDVMKTEALFVSHPHIDHIGGAANLFFCFNKLIGRYGRSLPNNNTLAVFFPDTEVLSAIKVVAVGNASGKQLFSIAEHGLCDGTLLSDGNVKISAIHNRHIRGDGRDGKWHSFSFMIEAEGKKAVFSGDVASPSELDAFLNDGADLLIMETGHHSVQDVCAYACEKKVKSLLFTHHGRQILENRDECEAIVSEWSEKSGISIKICYDGMVESI